MINNHHSAWPQSGLQDAYLVYEIVAEGGITRMLAIYKDATTEKLVQLEVLDIIIWIML